MVPQIVLNSRLVNIRINESSYCILVKALCRIKKANRAFGLLIYMIDDGFELDERSCSLILSTLCEHGDLTADAYTGYLEEMFCRRRLDWCNVIRFLVKNGKGMDALNVLNQIKLMVLSPMCFVTPWCWMELLWKVIMPRKMICLMKCLYLAWCRIYVTYNVYLAGLFKKKNIDAGMDMLACIEKVGCKPDVATYNGILRVLCGSGELKVAKEVVNLMRSKGVQHNLKTYEIMIGGMINQGEISEACNLLEEMVGKGSVPQFSTFFKLLHVFDQTGPGRRELEVLRKIIEGSVALNSSC